MSVGLVMQFHGVGADKYDGIMRNIGLDRPDAVWPKGVISHIAGQSADGWCVVDVWETKADFDAFFANQLAPAFGSVGGLPEPQVTTFQVHNSHGHG